MKLEKAIDSVWCVSVVLVFPEAAGCEREVLEQLATVTDEYLPIVIDGGFNDATFLKEQAEAGYVEAGDKGLLAGISEGLDLAEGRYAALIDGRLMIREPGWLEHAIVFLEARPDVGLVSLGGWHAIDRDGHCRDATDQVDACGWRDDQPVWRFTEVAAAKGTGFVMRTDGDWRLDDSMGGSFCTVCADLSLQYRAAGFRVYSENVEHDLLGCEDDALEEGKIARKWADLLPLERRYTDERTAATEITELNEEVTRLNELNQPMGARYHELVEQSAAQKKTLEGVTLEARALEAEHAKNNAELAQLADRIRELEIELTTRNRARRNGGSR